MNTLKRVMVAGLALLALATGTVIADPDPDHGYSRIFVFGDSFSDPGNHFAVTGETANPPFDPMPVASYGVGGHHFTNGRTWVEFLAQEMELTDWAKPAYRDPAFGNYAYAFARARPVNPVGPSFGDQVQAWIGAGHCTGAPMNDTLFVVGVGAADIFDVLEGQDPMSVLFAEGGAIDSIATNIGILEGCGARNLLVANMPDVGISPMIPGPLKPAVTALTLQFNQFLLGVVNGFSADMNVSMVDFFSFSVAVMDAPEALGFTNVTDTCLSFGVIQNAFCKDRNGYLFWDPVHLTKKAHALLAEIALGQLPVPD